MKDPKQQSQEVLKRIKEIRNKKGYSQHSMAIHLSISQNAYYKIEKGDTKLDLERFIEIAHFLEVEPDELINGPNYIRQFEKKLTPLTKTYKESV